MGRWVDGMAYDDDYDSPKAPGIEHKPDPELTYLRNFWHYTTQEITLRELRLLNNDIAREFDITIPQEYSI